MPNLAQNYHRSTYEEMDIIPFFTYRVICTPALNSLANTCIDRKKRYVALVHKGVVTKPYKTSKVLVSMPAQAMIQYEAVIWLGPQSGRPSPSNTPARHPRYS